MTLSSSTIPRPREFAAHVTYRTKRVSKLCSILPSTPLSVLSLSLNMSTSPRSPRHAREFVHFLSEQVDPDGLDYANASQDMLSEAIIRDCMCYPRLYCILRYKIVSRFPLETSVATKRSPPLVSV